MVAEDEIKKLAYKLWEDDGYPEGKDVEHYYRAKQILEEQETRKPLSIFSASTQVGMKTSAPSRVLKTSGIKPQSKAK